MQDIWPQLKEWYCSGERFALATVVEASKPSPRGVGACLAIHEDGHRFIGSVSAGCIENEVIVAAQKCLGDGQVRWLRFGAGEGFPWEVGLSCGGAISVRIEPAPALFVGAIREAFCDMMESGGAGILVNGSDGDFALLDSNGVCIGSSGTEEWVSAVISDWIRSERKVETYESGVSGFGKCLFRFLGGRRRLFVVGASHIALHLVSIAKALLYEVIVIEPREDYARKERFLVEPDLIVREWPSKGLASFRIGVEDALVTITHDPKIDDQALEIALGSACGFIGALGSRKSHAARCRRLGKLGFEEVTLERIHGPVGLDIGSQTPAEIAVSICGQLIQRFSGKCRSAYDEKG